MKEYICDECGKHFNHHGNYLAHMNKKKNCIKRINSFTIIPSNNRIECNLCKMNFSTKWNFLQHYKRKHNLIPITNQPTNQQNNIQGNQNIHHGDQNIHNGDQNVQYNDHKQQNIHITQVFQNNNNDHKKARNQIQTTR